MSENLTSPLASPTPIAVRVAETASPTQVYEWLRQAAGEPPKPSLFPRAMARPGFAPSLLRALIDRREPMIDLAVATFGADHDVLMELWDRGDAALRMAIAANRFRLGLTGLDLLDVLSSGDDDLVRIAMENPGMTSPAVARVLERKAPLDQITDSQWLAGVVAVARNPVLSVKRNLLEERFETDGWVSACRGEAFAAAWRLPHDLPPSSENAEALEVLLGAASEFSPPLIEYGYTPGNQGEGFQEARVRFFRAMLTKWHRDDTPDGVPEIGRFDPDHHAWVRTVIAAAAASAELPGTDFRTTDDLATRRGFYRGSRRWTSEAARAAFERDGVEFLREAVGNDALHERGDLADTMRALIENFRDASDTTASFETRQRLKRDWHNRGVHLWRQDHLRYQHPDREPRPVDEEPFDRLELAEALDRIEREVMDSFRRTSATLNEGEHEGDADALRLSRMNFEATWNGTGASLSAFRRIARELAEARHRELDGKLLVAAVERGVWRVATTAAVAASVIAAMTWLF